MNKLTTKKQKIRKYEAFVETLEKGGYITNEQYLTDLKAGYIRYFSLLLGGLLALELFPKQLGGKLFPLFTEYLSDSGKTLLVLQAIGYLFILLKLLEVLPQKLKFLFRPAEALLDVWLKVALSISRALAIFLGTVLVVLIYRAIHDKNFSHWLELCHIFVYTAVIQVFVVAMEFYLANYYIEKYVAGRILPVSDATAN